MRAMPKRARVDVAVTMHVHDVSPVTEIATSVAAINVARSATFGFACARVAARMSFERAIADIPAEKVRCIALFLHPPAPHPPPSLYPPMVLTGFSPAMQYFADSFVTLVAAAPVAAPMTEALALSPKMVDAAIKRMSDSVTW